MTLRYWLSGPSILNGLVRQGISFNRSDTSAALGPNSADASLLLVALSPDGAVTMARDKTPAAEALDDVADVATPVIFAFRSPEAVEVVLAGARLRLAKAAVDAHGRLVGVSAGQVAAAIKSEASALSHEFDVIHTGSDAGQQRRLTTAQLAIAAILTFMAIVVALIAGCQLAARLGTSIMTP